MYDKFCRSYSLQPIIEMCSLKVSCFYEINPLSVADPEGGGGNIIGAKRRRGRVLEGDTPSFQVGGGPPPGKFLKNGCKWCILSPFFAEFVSIFPQKIVCNICDIRDVGEFSP